MLLKCPKKTKSYWMKWSTSTSMDKNKLEGYMYIALALECPRQGNPVKDEHVLQTLRSSRRLTHQRKNLLPQRAVDVAVCSVFSGGARRRRASVALILAPLQVQALRVQQRLIRTSLEPRVPT
jgi:hypothetical protein